MGRMSRAARIKEDKWLEERFRRLRELRKKQRELAAEGEYLPEIDILRIERIEKAFIKQLELTGRRHLERMKAQWSRRKPTSELVDPRQLQGNLVLKKLIEQHLEKRKKQKRLP